VKTKESPLALSLRTGLMLAFIAAVSFAFWHPLQSEESIHIQHLSKLAAENTRTVIAGEMRSHLLAQVRLAQICGFEENLTKREWKSYAKLFVAHHPGYLALQLVDSNDRVRLSFGQGEDGSGSDALLAAHGALRPALQESRRQRDVILTPAFVLRNGGTGHGVVAPIYTRDQLTGFMIAVFDDQKALEDMLADQAERGYAISVVEGNEQVYMMPDSNPQNKERWQEEAELSLPGTTWNIRVWPKSNLLGMVRSKLPQLALVTGALIGLLLMVALDCSRTGYVKRRELRRTRDQLEIRVRDRTAELKALHVKLEAEVFDRKLSEEEFFARLLRVRDEEQRRIARELHDGTTQTLAALAIDLERLREVIALGDSPRAQRLLSQSSDLTEEAIADLRTVSYLLHPPILDALGLEAVIPSYVAGFSRRSGINVNFNVQPELGRLPQEVKRTVFRILQEALTNIHRHSESSTAEIVVWRDENQVVLQIVDHGRGIPIGILDSGMNPSAFIGIGIAGMRERVWQLNGCLDIESTDHGTSIKVTLPLETSESPRTVGIVGT